MNIDNFNYELPDKLIAQYPPKNRGGSKLLVANPVSTELKDLSFQNFITFIRPNDLIIFNNTKVIKARLFGKKETGGKVEILIEQVIDDQNALAMIKSSKKINMDIEIILPTNIIQILEIQRQTLFRAFYRFYRRYNRIIHCKAFTAFSTLAETTYYRKNG